MGAHTDLEAATGLWSRLARPFVLVDVVDALLGLSTEVVQQLAGVTVAVCDEAASLLADAPTLVRSLSTSMASVSIRTRGEVRGPVLWSETMSARAATAGDTDLFVCKSPQRDYDTPENQVLVRALKSIVDAGNAVELVGAHEYDDNTLRLARDRAREARRYLDHPALARVSREHLKARTLKRAKNGKKGHRYENAFRMLDRASEPLNVSDLLPFCDRRTRLQHRMLLAAIEELEARGLTLPAMRVEGGILLAGPLTYIHPRRLRTRAHVHGLLVGDVLVDVPERFRGINRARAEESLTARAGGRPSILVIDESEVPRAIDIAIRRARELTRSASEPIFEIV
jgi:hypothetical protein